MVIRIDEEKVKRIADHYGWNNQLRQLAEECSELSVEALHCIRERGETERLSEEMADVEIMIEQIVYLAKIDRKDIEECIQYKLERQMKRIEDESFCNAVQDLHAHVKRHEERQIEKEIEMMRELYKGMPKPYGESAMTSEEECEE